MAILDLFPTPVGIYELNRDVSDIEKETVLNFERRSNSGNLTSKPRNIVYDYPELNHLKSFFDESIQDYCNNALAINPNEVSVYITQSWANYTDSGQYHHKHSHPNSYVSGVFYLQSSEEDKIHFFNSNTTNHNMREIRVNTVSYNKYNSESWWLEATQGRLYLFPSNFVHMVETVVAKQTRVSISFNTFLKGVVGSADTLTELILN
jgi:uncharacterized protein (TIGR02466 family)